MLSCITGNTYELTVRDNGMAEVDVIHRGEVIATLSIASWIDHNDDDAELLKDTLRIPIKGVENGYTQVIGW